MFCAVYGNAPVPVLNVDREKLASLVPYSTDVSRLV